MRRSRLRYPKRTRYDAVGLLLLAAVVWFIHLLCQLPY
jgi:hypothetical protein